MKVRSLSDRYMRTEGAKFPTSSTFKRNCLFLTTVLIIIIVLLTLFLSCLLLLSLSSLWVCVHLSVFTVSLRSFCFSRLIGKLTVFFLKFRSWVFTTQPGFRLYHVVFYSQLKSKVDNILDKDIFLCINLNIDDDPITSRYTHTHPCNSQTFRLLFTSLSLGTPFKESHTPVTPSSVSEVLSSSSFRS